MPAQVQTLVSALKNMGIKFVAGVDNFHWVEVLFVQAAYFLYAALARIVVRYLSKKFPKMPIMKNS